MVQGKVYITDDLTGTVLSGVDISSFLGGNYVYAAVYTVGHKPIWLGRCPHDALLSYAHLHGVIPLLDQVRISERKFELPRRSDLPPTWNDVNAYFVSAAGVTD